MNRGYKIVKWIAMAVLFVLLVGIVTMLLWNWLIPALFNGPFINFWQALGLLLLSKILFGGFGKKFSGHGGPTWKHRYYEKLSSMTPEDRERFKSRLREKWCSKDSNTSTSNSGPSNV